MDKTRSRRRMAESEKSLEIKPASKKVEKDMDDESEGEIEDNSSDDGEEDSDYEEMEDVEDGEGSDSDDSETSSGGTRRENVDPDVIIRWMPDGSELPVHRGNQTKTKIEHNPAFQVSTKNPPSFSAPQKPSATKLGATGFENVPSVNNGAATTIANRNSNISNGVSSAYGEPNVE